MPRPSKPPTKKSLLSKQHNWTILRVRSIPSVCGDVLRSSTTTATAKQLAKSIEVQAQKLVHELQKRDYPNG